MTLPTENDHAAPPVEIKKEAVNLSFLTVYETGELSRIKSNQTAISTPLLVVPAQTSSKNWGQH